MTQVKLAVRNIVVDGVSFRVRHPSPWQFELYRSGIKPFLGKGKNNRDLLANEQAFAVMKRLVEHCVIDPRLGEDGIDLADLSLAVQTVLIAAVLDDIHRSLEEIGRIESFRAVERNGTSAGTDGTGPDTDESEEPVAADVPRDELATGLGTAGGG